METKKINGYEIELTWQQKFNIEMGEYWKSIKVNKDFNKQIEEDIKNGHNKPEPRPTREIQRLILVNQ